MTRIRKSLFKFLKRKRYEFVKEWLLTDGEAIDIGAADTIFIEIMKEKGLNAIGLDAKSSRGLIKGNIQELEFGNKSFDVVTCFETLEHTHNPVRALKELKRICKNQLIISIPNEPWFSITRLGWCSEHLWVLTPKILEYYLGKPHQEKVLLGRYYFAEWRY